MICLVEHKTTSGDISPGSDYWKRLRLDAQVSTYFAGMRADGYAVEACIYDVIRKPTLQPTQIPLLDADGVKIVTDTAGARVTTKAGKTWRQTGDAELGYVLQTRAETADEYRVRLRASISEEPGRYYARGTVVRLDEDMRDAAYDAWHVGRAIRDSELASRWPRNPDACLRYGATCDFFAVCTREASLDDTSKYRRKDLAHEELVSDASDGKRRLPLLTTSGMTSFRRCAREYYISYVQRYTSVKRAGALRFGTLVHAGLEVWWQTVDLDATLAALAGETEEFDRVKAEELLRGYHYRWRNEPLSVLAVERQFRVPLINPATGGASKTYDLGGKVDAVVQLEAA